jgi:hypothetical protein
MDKSNNRSIGKVRIACIVIVMIISSSLPLTLMGEEIPSVQLAGLRVVGPGYGLNASELRAFHQKSGTTLALVVRGPKNKKIVEVDDSKCSLVKFTDNRGHNLLDGVDWGRFPKISKDGRLALIEVRSKSRPSPGACRIFAKGTIRIRVAASESTEKIEVLKLQVGTKVTIGNDVIQVMKVKKENKGLTLVLQISRKFKEKIKDIRFYTTSNNPVHIWSRSSFTFGNASQLRYNFDTKSISKDLKVEIDLWEGIETLNLPFHIKSAMGF